MKKYLEYDIHIYILLFFIFSFIGWVYEGIYCFLTDGMFVNRGFFYGPYLPIYGTGGVLILILLRKYLSRPILTFFLIMALCSVLEYATSYILEQIYHERWWDYSGFFLNVNGRICLKGAVAFGLGGCFFIYLMVPIFIKTFEKIPKSLRIFLCILLIAIFVIDFFLSYSSPSGIEV